ncbi:MAG: alpha-hydroxy-acid oxidizing protein, partial [Betaproteobacteria bacterium]|nr:alpha-hydroxy-acid oxidizing protein [Betaproteobacteria bacterium]
MSDENRRRFLQFLAASPVAAYAGSVIPQTLVPGTREADPRMWAPYDPTHLIRGPKDAINVFDFEPVCRQNVPPAHFGYMASGIDDEVTLRANREDFLKLQLRPRRLVDVSKVDMSVDILGTRYPTPIVIAPIGGQKSFHAEGEVATARAAKAGNHLMILSTVTTSGVEEVTKERGAPVWYQLYATNKWEVAKGLVTRAEKAGCPVVAVTIDRNGGRNQETLFRLVRTDTRNCDACHDRSSLTANNRRRAMYEGLDLSGLTHTQSSAMTWDFLKRLRDTTKMKIVLKGILAHEDATLAVQNGMDGIIVSNHGGRSEDSGRSTIDALPEILAAVKGRMPVLVDSGFRRGTDICKALAMGANAVCVGRPYIWGLGAFGQPGVERVMEILRTELFAIMQQVGAP